MDKIERIRRKVKELQDEFISIQPKDCSLELIKSYAGYAYLDKVLSFLDALLEEPDKSLEEDLEKMVMIDNVIMNMTAEGYNNGYKTRPFYEEVLRRFNARKE